MNATAVLLLDYQRGMCESGPVGRQPALAAQVEARGVIERAARVLSAARTSGTPVIHVRVAFDPSYELRTNRSARFDGYVKERAMLAGSPEAEFVDALAPLESEPVIDKGGVDAFVGTPLLANLVGRGLRHLVILGVATNLSVESTARHATDLGFEVSVAEDCCASFQEDLHDFAVERLFALFSTVTSSSDVIARLDGGSR